jgi:hypothetical protein
MKRFALLLLTAAAVPLLAAGCADTPAVCTTCPLLGGSYQVIWGQTALDCPGAMAPMDKVLNLVQDSSTLSGSLGALQLAGTIYEDAAFTLNGLPTTGPAATSDMTTLTGAPALAADGMTAQSLAGSYVATTGQTACTFSVAWSAFRF